MCAHNTTAAEAEHALARHSTARISVSFYNSFLITQAVYERQRLVAKQIQQIHVSLELACDIHVSLQLACDTNSCA